jgi:hypothetical protein
LSDLPPSAAALSPPTDPGRGPGVALVIGALDLAAKDRMVLQSLVRLLGGSSGLQLQFTEDIGQCNVVFVPGDWTQRLHSRCLSVHLLPESAGLPALASPGLALTAPLRAGKVQAVLQAAAVMLAGGAAAAANNGLATLFLTLSRHLLARDRRSTVLPLHDGRLLLADFNGGLLHGPMSLDSLLAGEYLVGEPRRAVAADHDAAATGPGLRLRDVVWAAAHRLGDDAVAGAELRGRYRLLRWPDATALARPGFPRLAALLTSRALGCAEASAASGASPATVRWFLQASLALGIAGPVDAAEPEAAARLPAAPPPAPVRVATEPPRSLLGRLRERLKLW